MGFVFPRPQLGWAAATSEGSRYPGEEGGQERISPLGPCQVCRTQERSLGSFCHDRIKSLPPPPADYFTREVRSPCAWRGGARPGSRVTGGD